MTFVTASLALAGLLAASIPIIIHLLSRQRRKPIEWAAMRFLLEAMRKHRRRLRTEQLLLLAVRCLIIVLLGAALARPVLTRAGILDRGGDRVVYLLIDNGLASGLTDESNRTSLHSNVQQAVEIVRSLSPNDRIAIATAARPARLLLSPPTADHGSVIRLLESLQPLDSPADIAGALRTLRPALEDHADERTHAIVYLLSDLRAGSATLETPLPAILRDLDEHITLLVNEPTQHPVTNVQITSIDPVRHVIIPGSADGSGQLTVRLQRHGGDLERDVTRVRLSGERIGRTEPRLVRWEPGQSRASVDFLVNFAALSPSIEGGDQGVGEAPAATSLSGTGSTPREIAVMATIDDDALNADNVHYIVLELREQLRVAMLDRRIFGFEPTLEGYRSGQWIRRALAPGNGVGAITGSDVRPVQIAEVDPAALTTADIRTADVVVATRPDLVSETGWEVLRDYVDRGGVLLVTPPGELNVHQWADRFVHAMDVPWRLSLEAAHHEDGLTLAPEQPASEILRLISSDLEELVRPVSVFRVLPVMAEEAGGFEPVLVFANGDPLLVAAIPGRVAARDQGSEAAETTARSSRGLVFYLAAAPQLDWTNLPGKPLMVPLLHEVVRQGVSSVKAMHRITAGDSPVLSRATSAREVVATAGRNGNDQQIALDDAGRPQTPLDMAGVYALRDAADQHLSTIAVNIDPRAGRTQTLAPPAVMSWLAGSAPGHTWNAFDRTDPAAAIHTAESGSPIAWFLLWIVLGLIAVETALQRWFSHAMTSTQAPKRPSVQKQQPLIAGGAA